MHTNIIKSIGINISIAVVFVILNTLALEKSLEETFVGLAILFGCITTVVNALFVSKLSKK